MEEEKASLVCNDAIVAPIAPNPPIHVTLYQLLTLSHESPRTMMKIQSLNISVQTMDFFLINAKQYRLNLSLNGILADIKCVFYDKLPRENWVMNENPMKSDKMTWTSSKTKMVWAPEERSFSGETLEVSVDPEFYTISILETDTALKSVTDHLAFLFHPKTVSIRLSVEQFPDWINLCVWEFKEELTRVMINSMEQPMVISHDDYRFLLEQGSKEKLLSFWMVFPPACFEYNEPLSLAKLSICGTVLWIKLLNLMTTKLEAVSLQNCRFYADDLRALISLFLADFWPKLHFFDLGLQEKVCKQQLEKRVLRGWNPLPPDENRRDRYFGQFSASCFHPYDCKDFLDIVSKSGRLASIGVDDQKFMMVVWEHWTPTPPAPSTSSVSSEPEEEPLNPSDYDCDYNI